MPLVRWALALVLFASTACAGSAGTSEEPLPTLRPGGVVNASPAEYHQILEGFEGKPLVVNFWATWCEPCKDEMPRLVDAANAYSGEVRFLGVDVEDGEEAAQAFIDRLDIPFPSIGDPRGEIRRAEEIVGLPSTQFFRADGELAFVRSGEVSEDVLHERLEELVKIGAPPRTPEPGAPEP